MFHHDARHTGHSESSAPVTNHITWKYKTYGPLRSSPAVVSGRVYVGSGDNHVYCLNASTGTNMWKYETGDYVHSSPAVVNDKVFVGSRDGYVYCLNSSNGSLIWKYEIGTSLEGGWRLPDSSPTVADGKVYIGSGDNCTYCLDASTGMFVWKYRTGDIVQSSPAVAEGRVYVGSLDQNIYCLNASTGNLVWRYEIPSAVRSSPAVAYGKVYVTTYTWIYCLDAYSGNLIWKRSLGSWSSGYEPRWCSSPAVAYGKVYVGSWDENLYCLDPTTGDTVWNYTTGNDVKSSPAVADDKVYVGSQDGNLYCLDAYDGSLVWKYDTDHSMISSPAVTDGRVYMGAGDLQVYCFGPKISTTIFCSVSSETVEKDSYITVSGSINPPLDRKTVTLTYKKPDGLTFNETVKTGSDGAYSEIYKPNATGTWKVTASWIGDYNYKGATSSTKSFEVKEKEESDEKNGCIIATATYGSELSPEVQFLRKFRDNTVLSTFAGSSFMTIFNRFYYSFSPNVASIIVGNSLLRDIMKVILCPLIGILYVSSATFSVFSFIPELGVVAAGLIASSLIGIVYFLPLALIFCFFNKFKVSDKIFRSLGLIWASSIIVMFVAEVTKFQLIMMASTGAFVLATISAATLTSLRLISKNLIH